MRYENRLPDDSVNSPGRHPLREFLRLSLFALLAILCLTLLLSFAGGRLGSLLPFSAEVWVTEKIDRAFVAAGEPSPFATETVNDSLEDYLQALSLRVQSAMQLDETIAITLHYSAADTVNAYATFGGHVYLFRGLLEMLPHENALAMLMAHEYSHVSQRHTTRGVGAGLALAAGTSLLPGGTGVQQQLMRFTTNLTSLGFSRDMETEADDTGLRAVHRLYGHVAGADDLFRLFMQLREDAATGSLDAFFSTHPLDQQRIDFIAEVAAENGWSTVGSVTPLPEQFSEWLQRDAAAGSN